MEFEQYELPDIWNAECNISLKRGNVLAIYTDDGPKGLCGQSMKITCPHTAIFWFQNEDDFRKYMENNNIYRAGVNAKIRHVVVGEYGDQIYVNKQKVDDECTS